MKTRLDLAYLGLLAALGLGCTPSAGSEGETGETSGTTSDTTTATETGSSTGDGDGDTTTTTGDGDTTTTTGDGDGDTTTTGDGDGDEPPPPACENPVPIMQAGTDQPSGFYTCDSGFIVRSEAVECLMPDGSNDEFCADFGGDCTSAADCDAKPYGGCGINDFAGICQCNYGCATDADCDEGSICACAGVAGASAQCIPSDCTSSDDCGGGLCGLSLNQGVCENSYSGKCTGPTDECLVASDCEEMPCPGNPDGEAIPYYCTASGDPGWTCEAPSQCDGVCGRPFFVEGEIRVAGSRERQDWCASLTELDGLGDELEPGVRERLAAHWREVGGFEHASVASFARFIGHLQQLGAPAELIRASQRAAIDEIEHARLAYALASAYAGTTIGPAALPIEGAVERNSDRLEILDALIHEACVGETLAALEAREAAARTEDPRVATTLGQIAEDELRHASLGWRALQWMLASGSAAERGFVERRLARALAETSMALEVPSETAANEAELELELERHGLLGDLAKVELRRRAIDEVLVPLAAALTEAQPAGPGASIR